MRSVLWLVVLLTFTSAATWAHDPTEITAKARLYADRIELEFVLAKSTAERLVRDRKNQDEPPHTPGDFGELKSRLEARSADIVAIMTGERRLVARKTFAELTRDGDVRLALEFSSADGPLRLEATLLRTLGAESYFCWLTIYPRNAKEIQNQTLWLEKSACDLVAP